jgi:hypothetical protein
MSARAASRIATLGFTDVYRFVSLPAHKVADVGALRPARAPDRDDLLDLGQHEVEPLRLPDERQQAQRV